MQPLSVEVGRAEREKTIKIIHSFSFFCPPSKLDDYKIKSQLIFVHTSTEGPLTIFTT